MPGTIFIFFDGIGIGRRDKSNPFLASGAEYLPLYEDGPTLPDGTPIKAIDACLGVDGMPMSATGQTTLFTGVNMPRLLNAHRDSYPDHTMRRVIREYNLMTRLRKYCRKTRFLNAYPFMAHFFTPENVRLNTEGEFYFSPAFPLRFRNSLSVTTCMMVSNCMTPYNEKDIIRERAIFHDFTNEAVLREHTGLPVFSPEKAAEIIYKTSRDYDFLLYEYFRTDMYGHGFERNECVTLIQQLNRLLSRLVYLLDQEKDNLIITSDHGNLEDTETQLHTENPVPLITWGKNGDELRERIDNLADVTPAIERLLER